MKHGIAIKFVTILLCAVSVVMSVGGGYGIVAMESAGLYVNDVSEIQEPEMQSIAKTVARSYATFYAVRTLSNLSYQEREDMYDDPLDRGDADYWTVKIERGYNVLVYPDTRQEYQMVKTYTFAPEYPMLYTWEEINAPEFVEPENYLYKEQQQDWFGASEYNTLYYFEAPEYTITVYLQEEVLQSSAIHILKTMYPYRFAFIAVMVIGIILFAASMVALLWMAGKDKSGKIRPGGLNRVPLDLYALASAGLVYLLWNLLRTVTKWTEYEGPHLGNLSLMAVNLMAITLPILGWLFALSAQAKLRNGYMWHRSFLGFCLVRLGRGIKWLAQRIAELLRMMPVIWQWLICALVLTLALTGCLLLSIFVGGVLLNVLFVLCLVACLGLACYSGYALGTLLTGVQKMTRQELSHKIQTGYLSGPFLDCAQEVNALSDTAIYAAQQQLRSERTKSELITNVSHDIKTPLTSIINFVDLLQKPHTPEQTAQYLDVLSRQSARMKKLIEDLIELSKASSGSIHVSLQPMDAAEAVNQALGEFSDKLAAAELTPVFVPPEAPVGILADGRLFWRVLSNLLSNAIKYSLPGTRLYIALDQAEDMVVLSLKNISRAPLNLTAEELMERFVRGDASRTSEGSGLGLNIASTLMELQHGKLQLLVDGDLFKVTLCFPKEEATRS